MGFSLQDLKENPTRYIKSMAMDLIVVVTAIAYVFYNMVKFEITDTSAIVITAQAVMGIVCGVVIKQSLGENGFSRGYNSKYWSDEEEKYNGACNTANQYMERVDNFYLCEEIEKKKNYRRQHLQSVRLKYSLWFDDEGNYIGTKETFENLTKTQKRMVNKCIKVRIYILNLFSEYETSSEQDTKKEMTDKKQRGKNITKNTITASVIAIIGVYFIPVLKMNWGAFIASTMQVTLWVLLGVFQLYKNYSYVVQDKVALLRRKKELIKKFTTGCDEGLYINSPYDEIKKVETQSNTMIS